MSKFRKWHLREPKFAKFPGGPCPRTPLEARAFGANNYSLFSITWGWNLCYLNARSRLEIPVWLPWCHKNNLYICNVPSTRIWYSTSHYSREGLLKSIEVFVLRIVCLRFGLKPRGDPAPSQTNPLQTEPRRHNRTDKSISHSYGLLTFTFLLLNINWAFRGEVVRQRILVRGIFGKKQTDAILLILHHLWNGARHNF